MPNQRTYRAAAILVGTAALLIILERLWNLALIFQDIILLFALAWLISFTLAPLVEWLKRPYYSEYVYRRLRPRIPPLAGRHLLPHWGAVSLVYLAMVCVIIIGTGSVIPAAIAQGQNLTQALPDLPNRLPAVLNDLQRQLAAFGISVDLRGLYQSNLEPQLNQIGVGVMRELINGLSVVAATVSNLLLVLILSLYMSLGGRDLGDKFVELIPRHYHRDLLMFARSVNKNFGGFIRGQLIQSLLAGIATAVVMIVMRLDFVVLAAILSALVMLLPLIGVFLAIIPPVLVALFAGSLPTALIVFVLLFIFQQVLMNAIMPKILSDSVGLHPLLVFAALLTGVRVGGIWGAFFGIPIAGVMYALLIFFGGRIRRASEDRKAEEAEAKKAEEVKGVVLLP
jgi:predicted PurR-regulated permease PerM